MESFIDQIKGRQDKEDMAIRIMYLKKSGKATPLDKTRLCMWWTAATMKPAYEFRQALEAYL